jgi:HK97 family phage major capsid protein
MDPKLKQILEQSKAKLAELQAIAAKGAAMTAEDVVKGEELKGELATLRGQAEEAKRASSLGDEAKQFDDWLNAPANRIPQANLLGFTPAGETQIESKNDEVRIEQYGAGVLTERQMKAISTKEYKRAYLTYIRKGQQASAAVFKVLQEGIDDEGGYIAPADLQNRLIEKKPTPTRVNGYVTTIETSRDAVVMPRVVYATDDLYTTGVRVTWTGEVPASSTVHRATQPVFGTFRVPIYTAMLSIPVTVNLMEDAAFDLEAWLEKKIRETIDLLKDNMILNGTGVDQPSGILQNPGGTNEPDVVVTGSAAAITADGLINIAWSVPEQYEENERFIFNKTATGKAIAGLKDSSNRYLFSSGDYANSGIATARPKELLGYPFNYSGFMPSPGANTFPLIFGDAGGYFLANRVSISIQVLREIAAQDNQVIVLCRVRFGGDVAEPWRLKIQKCST